MTMRRSIANTVVTIVLATAALAACTTTRNGSPTSQPETTISSGVENSSSTPPGNDTFGAPRVANPLNATRFLTQPCAVLNPAQMGRFTISKPGEADTDSQIAKASGPGCTWKADTEPSRGYSMSFLTGNKKGLSDIYRGKKQLNQFDYFEPTSVEGYPAVFADGSDGRSQGSCDIKV